MGVMWTVVVLFWVGLTTFLLLEQQLSRDELLNSMIKVNNANNQNDEHQSQSESEKRMSSNPLSADMLSNQGWRFDRKIQDCQSTALKQTFPNIDYSLYGYNILKGYPLHDGKDPGFTRPIFSHNFTDKRFTADCRYSIPRGVTVAPDVSCVTSFTSTVVQNSYDFQKSLSVHAKASAGGYGVSFSASGGYQETVSVISSGQTKVILSTAHCNQYFTKFNWFEPPEFSAEMKEWIHIAEKEYKKDNKTSDNSIYRLFEYFGTHMPVETLYGARYTYEHRLDSSKMEESSSKKLSADVEASISAFGFSGGFGFGMSDEEKQSAKKFKENVETRTISVGAPPPYNGDAMTWASTVKDNPVPVSTTLEPIYSVFDRNYMKQTFISDELADHLQTRIQKISGEYCRYAQRLGTKVECTDKSVLKFPRLQAKHDQFEESDSENENSCLDECHKRSGCVMVSWVKTAKQTSCRIYKYPTNHRSELAAPFFHPQECPDQQCSLYIIQTRITGAPLRLRGVSYKTGQRNKLKLSSSTDQEYVQNYKSFSSICGYLCSKDALCIAFEVAVGQSVNEYERNCATFAKHDIKNLDFKNTDDDQSDFDIQLLSKTAKQKVVEDLRNMEFVAPCGYMIQTKSIQRHTVDTKEDCQEKCKAKADCTSFSYFKNLTECAIGSSQGAYTYKHRSQLCSTDEDTFKLLPQKELRGWTNITNLEVTTTCSETKAMITDEQKCAKECLRNVNCYFASYYNENCRQMKSSLLSAEIETSCFSFRD